MKGERPPRAEEPPEPDGGGPLDRAGRADQAETSFTRSLRERYGDDVDPRVSLAGSAPADADLDASNEILKRLSAHGLKESRYKLIGEIARGGMGAILKVWDEDLRRELAMKVVLGRGDKDGSRPSTPATDVDPKALGRFLEEAQITGQLDHPGIVPVHELGLNSEGGVYFTMRLVKGRDLSQIFRLVFKEEEGWNTTRALGVLLKVSEAMAFAHDKHVIHRDLKPANIMVGRFGEVYVMDWGLARVIATSEPHDLRVRGVGSVDKHKSSVILTERRAGVSMTMDSALFTMDGDVVGTPAYMSPEQARGKISELDARTDVYAAGAMLYHLLARRMPYAPADGKITAFDVLMAAREGPPQPLIELNAHVPGELVAITEKAMAREPGERYADMEELGEDLRAYLEHRVVKAYETGAVAELKKWVSRNKGLASASAAAVMLLIAGLATSSTLFFKAERNAELAEQRRILADESASIAQKSATLALQREQEADAERVKVLRLSDVKRLKLLEEEAADLWPAYPPEIERYEAWLARAHALAGRMPDHEQALADLRSVALPLSDEEQVHDRKSHPRLAELQAMEEHRAGHQSDHPDAPELNSGFTDEELVAHVAGHEEELAALRAEVSERRTWLFATTEEQWQDEVLFDLVSNLSAFTEPEQGLVAEVEDRLAFARTVRERTLTGADAARRWREVIVSIADPTECPEYGGLALTPQLGLLPIGRDPVSGLWEFASVQTGDVPERDEWGALLFTENTCIVLVLIPGGTLLMGGQNDDPDLPNYDPDVRDHEAPTHEVALDPFLLSKYEMTQGQWLRFTRTNPSEYGPEQSFLNNTIHNSLLNPVELVSWLSCDRVLAHMGLVLPTEAQWEYAARAGTSTAWWTGSERESLVGTVNLADQTGQRGGGRWATIKDWPDLDDGYVVHAPVGTYLSNAFGLHEIHGNVWEWTRDWYGEYDLPVEPGTGLRQATKHRFHVYRGSSFLDTASSARCASREPNTPQYTGSSVGVRPARELSRD